MIVSDLVSYSLRIAGVLGVGQVPLAQDTDDALLAFDLMVAQWERKRWLVYRLEDLSCQMIPGKQVYALGVGAVDINTFGARPANIDAAYMRQLTGTAGPSSLPVDFPLRRIDSLEEWSRIALKNLKSWPSAFYYDPSLPNGGVYIWPIPIQNFFELHVVIQQTLRNLPPTIEVQEELPAETEEALVYNLAARLRINYQLPPNQDLNALARATLGTLRSTNLRIQKLAMPAAVMGRGGRWKNPSAGFYPEMAAGVPYTVTGT